MVRYLPDGSVVKECVNCPFVILKGVKGCGRNGFRKVKQNVDMPQWCPLPTHRIKMVNPETEEGPDENSGQ